MTSILVAGRPGGRSELIANLLKDAIKDANIKYMDSFDTAYTFMNYNETILVYTGWEAERQMDVGRRMQQRSSSLGWPDWTTALPGKHVPNWLYHGFDSFVSTTGGTLEKLTNYDPDKILRVGVDDLQMRIIELENVLKSFGHEKYEIVPYSCFAEIKSALTERKDIDFLFGNSINMYRNLGAVEILTTRNDADATYWLPNSGVEEFRNYIIKPPSVFRTPGKTHFGYISQNIESSIIVEHLTSSRTFNDDDLLARGYIRSDSLESMFGLRAQRDAQFEEIERLGQQGKLKNDNL